MINLQPSGGWDEKEFPEGDPTTPRGDDRMPAERVKRKPAAILSADVKGYSRLTGEDEVGTIRTLNAYLGAITGFLQKHQGRVVTTGKRGTSPPFPRNHASGVFVHFWNLRQAFVTEIPYVPIHPLSEIHFRS